MEGLFTKPKNKKVETFDLYGDTYIKDLRSFKFRPSVYGILVEDGRVLLKRNPLIDKFDLPGGGVELGETPQECLIREFKEETGLIVEIDKILDIQNDFFTFQNVNVQGILIFF